MNVGGKKCCKTGVLSGDYNCDCPIRKFDHNLNSIMFHPPNPLMKQVLSPLKADEYQLKSIAVWWPEFFFPIHVKHIPCPHCGPVAGNVISKGFKFAPRLVFGTYDFYYIISKQYYCNLCEHYFMGYDPDVLKHLPRAIADECPAFVGRKSAIDKNLVVLLRRQVSKGQSFLDAEGMFDELKYSS